MVAQKTFLDAKFQVTNLDAKITNRLSNANEGNRGIPSSGPA